MALKNPSKGSELLFRTQVLQAAKLDQELGVQLFPAPAEEREGIWGFDSHSLYPPAPLENLELGHYRVALLSRGQWEYLRGLTSEPPCPAETAVLLPFTWKELITEFHEFVRDSNGLPQRKVARFADVCIDFIKMEVKRLSGEVITLTRQEFRTLKCFLSNPERVFSRDELLNEAWGYNNYPTTRTVDNHVLKLRQKFERDPARPVHFRTVHSVGYKFVP